MRMRKLAASLYIGAVALFGLETAAGAAAPGFTVPATTIEAGTTLQVTLTDECRNALGEEDYGNLIQGGPISDNQETKNTHWIKGDTGVFRFPLPGTYKLGRFCDATGYMGFVMITVVAPSDPTPTTPSTAAPTTAVPATSSPATSAPGTPTTAPSNGGPATTAQAGGVTTTTAAVAVEGRTSTRSGATTQAAGATPVAGNVAYTG